MADGLKDETRVQNRATRSPAILPRDPALTDRPAVGVRRIDRTVTVVMVPNRSKVWLALDRLDQRRSSRSQAIPETRLRKREPNPLSFQGKTNRAHRIRGVPGQIHRPGKPHELPRSHTRHGVGFRRMNSGRRIECQYSISGHSPGLLERPSLFLPMDRRREHWQERAMRQCRSRRSPAG